MEMFNENRINIALTYNTRIEFTDGKIWLFIELDAFKYALNEDTELTDKINKCENRDEFYNQITDDEYYEIEENLAEVIQAQEVGFTITDWPTKAVEVKGFTEFEPLQLPR